MTAQIISAHSVKMRFPEFQQVPSSSIEFAIEEAALSVDATWGDYQAMGMLYMTAHILMMTIARAASGTGQEIASESWPGVVALTYKPTPTLADACELEQTFYGKRALELMQRVITPVAII